MIISTSSAYLNLAFPLIKDGVVPVGGIILSAFLGGLFAGLFSNHFESRRRIKEKRYDKYFEHRNSIVQIEHELIPLRIDISRNLETLNDAISNTNENNIRFILRLYSLSLSPGLSLKLLSLDLINNYAQLYTAIESFNSDIKYLLGMVSAFRESGPRNVDQSLVESYKTLLPHMKDQCERIDEKSLQLLSECKLAIKTDDEKIKDQYMNTGKDIKYSFNKKSLQKENLKTKKEESGESHVNERQPKFFSPFLDLKRT